MRVGFLATNGKVGIYAFSEMLMSWVLVDGHGTVMVPNGTEVTLFTPAPYKMFSYRTIRDQAECDDR